MGEIFRRETAEHPEPFTGERLTTAIGGQVQIEHYHRYLFARTFAQSLDVLDVASGEGYGSALLAQVARSVVGVEYSGPTARNAGNNFRNIVRIHQHSQLSAQKRIDRSIFISSNDRFAASQRFKEDDTESFAFARHREYVTKVVVSV